MNFAMRVGSGIGKYVLSYIFLGSCYIYKLDIVFYFPGVCLMKKSLERKGPKKINLSSFSRHHNISFCLFITHSSSPSGSLCIRREDVRAIYFTVLYVLLILMIH